jgi:acyl carrier protein
MDPQDVRAELVVFLLSVSTPGCQLDDIDDSINLIDAGIMDSFALIQVIFYLEQNHGCDLQALEIDPVDLGCIK